MVGGPGRAPGAAARVGGTGPWPWAPRRGQELVAARRCDGWSPLPRQRGIAPLCHGAVSSPPPAARARARERERVQRQGVRAHIEFLGSCQGVRRRRLRAHAVEQVQPLVRRRPTLAHAAARVAARRIACAGRVPCGRAPGLVRPLSVPDARARHRARAAPAPALRGQQNGTCHPKHARGGRLQVLSNAEGGAIGHGV